MVYERAGELAAELLEEVLSARPSFSPQPEEGATYADRLTPEDRELDWNRPPVELLNQIRALSPHIGARGEVDGRRLTVWRARLGRRRLAARPPAGSSCSTCSPRGAAA